MTILLIADDDESRPLLEEALQPRSKRVAIHHARGIEESLNCLLDKRIDAVLIRVKQFERELQSCKVSFLRNSHIPVVVITEEPDDVLGFEAVQAGAQDFFYRGEKDVRLIRHIIGTAIKRSQKYLNLRAEEFNWRNIITNNNKDGVLIVNEEGIILFGNSGAQKMLHRSAEELLGSPFGFAASLDRTTQITLHHPEEGEMTVQMQTSAVTWKGERCYLNVLHDVTEIRREADCLKQKTHELSDHIAEHREEQEKLKSLAMRDELTGLYNRRGFMIQAQALWRLAKRKSQKVIVLYMDLNGLKFINDSFGHPQGDRALRKTGRILADHFRDSDVLGRLGGDEFACFLVDSSENFARCSIVSLQEKLFLAGTAEPLPYSLSLSIGWASCARAGSHSLEKLMELADRDMYEKKKAFYARTAREDREAPPPGNFF